MQIESVTVHASDLTALQSFYGERLGLPVAADSSGSSLTVQVGTSALIFEHAAGSTGRYHFAFNLPEHRLGAAVEFLAARGIALIADAHGETRFHFDFWDADALYFYDSAGNIAEFIVRNELPNTSPVAANVPFSPAELLSISEIGLPTNDIAALARDLSDRCGIAPYREGSPVFAPVGDANGLFILVPTGRIWFPDTGIPAKVLPLHTIIRNDAGLRFEVSGLPYRSEPIL